MWRTLSLNYRSYRRFERHRNNRLERSAPNRLGVNMNRNAPDIGTPQLSRHFNPKPPSIARSTCSAELPSSQGTVCIQGVAKPHLNATPRRGHNGRAVAAHQPPADTIDGYTGLASIPGFDPQLRWMKQRQHTDAHRLFHALRATRNSPCKPGSGDNCPGEPA